VAGERLKFRCYQCNQLLASAPGKAGSIVSCPRCKADLVVPGPESSAPGDSESSSVGRASGRSASTISPPKPTVPGDPGEDATDIPADLIDLRPEDLRVEAEFFHSLTRASEAPREPEPAPWTPQIATATYPAPDPVFPAAPPISAPVNDRPGPAPAAPPPTSLRPEAPAAVYAPAPLPPLLPPMSPEVPPIEIDTPSLRAPTREGQMVRDVVIPASAVLAWSLFGLIGIATSFIAGLMLGHYFWRM
jgi:hypothetical protein